MRIDRMLAKRHRQGFGPGLSLLSQRATDLCDEDIRSSQCRSRDPVTDRTLFQIGSITSTSLPRLPAARRAGATRPLGPGDRLLAWFKVDQGFDADYAASPSHAHGGARDDDGLVPSSWRRSGYCARRNWLRTWDPFLVLQRWLQRAPVRDPDGDGLSFDATLHELVFAPLGMDETWGEVFWELYPRLADGHSTRALTTTRARPEKQAVVNRYRVSQGARAW